MPKLLPAVRPALAAALYLVVGLVGVAPGIECFDDLRRLTRAGDQQNEIRLQGRGGLRIDDLQCLAGRQRGFMTRHTADRKGSQPAPRAQRRNRQLAYRASQDLALDRKPGRQQQFDLGIEEIVLGGFGAFAGGHGRVLGYAAIVWGEGGTVITVPFVIRTIRPRSAPVMSR